MPKYYVEWPVEKMRSVEVAADSAEEAIERAKTPEFWTNAEIDSHTETNFIGKERWKRATAIDVEEHKSMLREVETIMARRKAKRKGK